MRWVEQLNAARHAAGHDAPAAFFYTFEISSFQVFESRVETAAMDKSLIFYSVVGGVVICWMYCMDRRPH